MPVIGGAPWLRKGKMATQIHKTINATIAPANPLHGVVQVPGDKSISHRLAMLASLAQGRSVIRNYLRSEDCLNTLRAVAALGADVSWRGDVLYVTGQGWRVPVAPLDLGNSGTSLRLLAGLLAGRPWATVMTGDESLCRRPMERIRHPLELMGARLEFSGARCCAPLTVHGGNLRGIEYRMPVASAQVKSCVLLAGLFAEGDTTIWEPLPTRNHTEIILQALGVELKVDGLCVRVRGYGPEGPELLPYEWLAPGDFSSAAFWLTAAAAGRSSSVTMPAVGLNGRRTALLDILRRMGAEINVMPSDDESPEAIGTIEVRGRELYGTTVSGAEIPAVIDELPLVAVAGVLADGETLITNAGELRVKESDRIACMAANLRLIGAEVEEFPDGMRIRGGCPIRGGVRVKSYGDHRVAMAMAVAALFASDSITIEDVGCVGISYPEFWRHLRELGGRVELTEEDKA